MKKLTHSLLDWEFSTPGPYLDDTIYVSPPTSLAAKRIDPFNRYGWAFCKHPDTLCLSDGRLATWLNMAYNGRNIVMSFFRAQATPPIQIPDNCYYFDKHLTSWAVDRYVGGHVTVIGGGALPNPFSLYEWVHFRVSWYTYINVNLQPILRILVEREIDGHWIEQGHCEDEDNMWADSDVNRVGFYLAHGGQPFPSAIDDSEIWRKTR